MSAVVNGRVLDVSQVQVDRSLPDPLAGGSLTAASASLTAVEGDDVTRTVATPWDPSSVWPPAPESPVSVSMDTGAGAVSLLAGGRVVSASGGTSGREVEVEAADRYQSLDRTISWDALADAMPSATDGVYPRYVGLRASALTDRILRHCGWFATPPRLAWCITSVPAMGTMWPEVGVCRYSESQATQSFPGFFTESWGSAVTDVSAEYAPVGTYSLKSRGRMELTAVAGRTNGGTMRLDAVMGAGDTVRLAWTDSTASVWVTDGSGSTASVVSLPRGVGDFLYATLVYGSDTSLAVTLRVGSVSVTGTASTRASLTNTAVSAVRVNGSGVGGGFQVAMPSTSGALSGWTPNAVVYERNAQANTLYVAPPVEGENCADLLAQQCEAQNATYWIDETGVLRWWDLARLESQANVATLTSADDVAEGGFSWSHDLSSVKSRVAVNWREPLRERSWWSDVDLWQGNGGSLQVGAEVQEEWITTPADEVWIMPDLSLDRLGSSGAIIDFNRGMGSWYGAVFDNVNAWSSSVFMTVERVTDDAFKLTTTVSAGSSGTIIQKTLPEDTSSSPLWMSRRGVDLPIIRGKAKFTLTDQITYSSQSGPSTAPEHAIDAGWWIQRPDQAQITADYAAARLTVPQPVLSSVDLVPLPGLQLGDMVTVQDTLVTRLTIKGIVTDDSRDIDAAMGMSHAVTIRPVSVSRNGVTWQEWASVTRKTWSQWQTSEGGTWQQWGSNPLNE